MTWTNTATRSAAICVLLAAAACDGGTAVDEVRFSIVPPDAYAEHYAEAEACSGLTGDFERVKWFWTMTFPGQAGTVGQWNPRREITILWRFRFDRRVIVHEALHDLLGGDKDHSDRAWDDCDVPKE